MFVVDIIGMSYKFLFIKGVFDMIKMFGNGLYMIGIINCDDGFGKMFWL